MNVRLSLPLLLLLASCTVIGPNEQFRQPVGTGASVSGETGDVVGANEAMPPNTDSLEVGRSTVAIEIHATSGSIIMGDLNAPVTLTMFDDYGCFYCREFGSTDLSWVLQTYAARKKLKVERIVAPQSAGGTLMAKVALCSEKQNLFETTDTALHSSPIAIDTQVVALAKTLKLNLKSLQTCMNSSATQMMLETMATRTKEVGVTRFPSFAIGDERWMGVLTRDELQKKIDAAL